MVSRQRLLERSQPLSTSTGSASQLAERVDGLRVEPAGHRPFQLRPGEPPWLATATISVEGLLLGATASHLPGLGIAGVAALLLAPARVYELASAVGRRRVAVLASVVTEGQTILLRGIIEAPVIGGTPTDSGTIAITGASLQDERARGLLLEVADDLTPSSLASLDPDGAPPVALVVGDLPPGGRDAMRRRLWAHGVRLEGVLEGPYRRYDEARRRVEAFKGDLLLLSVPGCRDVIGKLVAVASPEPRPVLLLGEGELEYQLLEVDERLDEHHVDLAHAGLDVPAQEISWSSVAEFVTSEQSDYFAVTGRCLRKLPGCPYSDPARMRDQLERLARLARAWAKRDGSIGGRLEDWARTQEGLEIALHDAGLVRRRLHEFQFSGLTYNREPHVKVDDAKAFTDCGRIYFALDREGRRFIVDHIGLHPY